MSQSGHKAFFATALRRVGALRTLAVARLVGSGCSPHAEWVRFSGRSLQEVGRPHSLPCDEIVVCLQGAARLALGAGQDEAGRHPYVSLSPGRGVLIPAGAVHYETFERRSETFALLWVVFPPGMVVVAQNGYNADRTTSGRNVTMDGSPSRVAAARFLRELGAELAGAPPFSEVRVHALLMDLLVHLSRTSPAQAPDSLAARRWRRFLVRDATRYLDENYSRPVSLGEVARRLRLSPNYLSTIFHHECGQTFRDYLAGVRVKRAQQLLCETGRPLKAIARAVGLSDEYYFSRVFKRVVGVPPGAFRKAEESPRTGGSASIAGRRGVG